jgi:hypothetical protein
MKRGRFDVVLALAGYAAVDVILGTCGYHALQRIVRRWPVRRRAGHDAETPTSVAAALDRAAVWYPRTRLCLARSAVATCLLRWHGLPGQMIVGARLMPFHAHAWVELDGHVVADLPSVRTRYLVLDRI